MVLASVLVRSLLLVAAATSASSTVDRGTDCWPGVTPQGALLGQPEAVFCAVTNQGGSAAQSGPNRWLDDFEGGISRLDLEGGDTDWQPFSEGLSFADWSGTPYRLFETQGVEQSVHWRHASHWMVDVAPDHRDDPFDSIGGAMLRPDASFQFEAGRFVVETDFAATHSDYQTRAWGEILVTTASEVPPLPRTGALYGYDRFPDDWTLGCRLQDDRHTICSLLDDSPVAVDAIAARRWEMSFFQHVGTSVFGGQPGIPGGDAHFRDCGAGDPDTLCRDRFRLELTETSVTVWVNGLLYFQQTGIPPLPDALLNGDLYVYLGSMVAGHPGDVIRYHWDRVAVHPQGPPGPSDTF